MATIPIFSLLPNSVVLRLDATITVSDNGPQVHDVGMGDSNSRKVAFPIQTVTVPPGASNIDQTFATAWRAAHDGFLVGLIIGL